MHGGKPKDFEDLTVDDIQVIYTTYTSLQVASSQRLLKGLVEVLRG